MTIYVYSNYNNYYNRIVKYPGDSISDYPEPVLVQPNFNFVPNDSVNTTVLLGSYLRNFNGDGDYLIVCDENNDILSRWFIIDSIRDRGGQFTLTLHRDLIVDYYDAVLNSPCFIEKSNLSIDNPLIFNNENMTFNQIKTNEFELKDETACPWLIGYYSRSQESLIGAVSDSDVDDANLINLSTPITGWSYAKYSSIDGASPSNTFKGEIQSANYLVKTYSKEVFGLIRDNQTFTVNYENGTITAKAGQKDNGSSLKILEDLEDAIARHLEGKFKPYLSTLKSQLYGPEGMPITANYEGAIKDFKDLNGKMVRDSSGAYYLISLGTVKTEKQTVGLSAGALFNTLTTIISETSGGYFEEKTPNENSFSVEADVLNYTLTLTKASKTKGITYSIDSDHAITEDAPWNVFAIPFGNIKVLEEGTETEIVETNAELGLRTAMSMLEQHPSIIYDIQLLPYCPLSGQSNKTIYVSGTSQYGKIIETNNENEIIKGIILNITNSRFTKTLNYNFAGAQTAIEKKLNNECDKWRLTSPNYSSYFDFSVEKNNGVYGFNIDCEYKPYTPYIHINPIFSGLYGYDDNSPRGLVLGGDFSLSSIIDQWEQYQIQNKNFQNIFDRQIQNMEIQQNIQRKQESWQVAAGTIQGASSGAFTGAMVGGGYGAIAGAVVGGATSLAGGLADIKYNEQLRNEALDYTKDLFGYQLGNIQALPQTISKVSALNNNNKIFPILEYYTCTEEEKLALLFKLAYNGMTTMVINTILNYLGNNWEYKEIKSNGYIKGKLIRFNDEYKEYYNENFRIVNAIAEELNKGVYFN